MKGLAMRAAQASLFAIVGQRTLPLTLRNPFSYPEFPVLYGVFLDRHS